MKAFLFSVALLLPAAAQGQERELHLVHEATIGKVDGDPRYVLGAVADAALLENGDLLLLDRLNAVVRLYDRAGIHKISFGRTGSGPGEFQMPALLQVRGDTVSVFDLRLQRTSHFSIRGQHLSTEAGGADREQASAVYSLANGNRLRTTLASFSARDVAALRAGRNEARPLTTVKLTARDHRAESILTAFDQGSIAYYESEAGVPFGYVGGAPFGRGGVLDVVGDSMVTFVEPYIGRISWMAVRGDRMQLVRRVGPFFSPERVSSRDMKNLEAELRTKHPWLPRRFTLSTPAYKAKWGQVVIMDDGDVWVSEGDNGRFTIHSAVGSPIRRATMPRGVSPVAGRNDRVVTIRRNEFDVPIIEIYRLTAR